MASKTWRSLACRFVAAVTLSIGPLAQAQAAPPASSAASQTVIDVLQQMSDRAAIIFVGQVSAIHRPEGVTGIVEVDFRVDQAIRGCSTGTYALREWSGLWAVNDQRYQVGQRVLMLLHAPSAAGLSSPVDGLDGAIPIRQRGNATPYQGMAPSAQIVDLRWLGTKLPRTVTYSSPGTYSNQSAARIEDLLPSVPFVARQPLLVSARSGAAEDVTVITPLSGATADASVPTQQASVDAVVGMLTAWEKVRHAAP